MLESGELFVQREEQTQAWAWEFAGLLSPTHCIALQGELGAGKTFVVREIAAALGVTDTVHSPSYALVNEYKGSHALTHIDLYRLQTNADWEEIGLDHYFTSDTLCLVEWPDRMGPNWQSHFDWVVVLETDSKKEPEYRRIHWRKLIVNDFPNSL